jgi:folate-binding protein YgfZ
MTTLSAFPELHLRLGARTEEHAGLFRVSSYGDPAAEYQALRLRAGLFDRSLRGKLRITGSDRLPFLHGMVTNDVKGLPEGRGAYAAIVTVKGKMVGDARILRRREDLLVDTEPGVQGAVSEHLNKHLISEDTEIHDVTQALALFSLVGPRAWESLCLVLGPLPSGLDEHQHEERSFGGVTCTWVGTRLGDLEGVDVFLPAEQAASFALAALDQARGAGLAPVGFEAMEIARVEAGLPRYGQDMGEDTLPLEANLEARAVSYSKGCYVGQEVIARVHYRGHTNRTLTGILFSEGSPPAQGTPLFKEVGEPRPLGVITSAVRSPRAGGVLCLGYLRREHLAAGTLVKTSEGREGRVTPLPLRS